jgi:alanine dehydrogenase
LAILHVIKWLLKSFKTIRVIKVKEPIESEYSKMRKGQKLFTYLHLAASKACTDALVASGTTAIAYETVEVNGTLPLLAPMSEVAGRLVPA